MKRVLSWIGTSIALIALMSSTGAPVAGQTATSGKTATSAKKADAYRTPWGDPDLQGIWTGSTLTPLERPEKLANKAFLTEEEVAQMEKDAAARVVDAPPATWGSRHI